MADVTGMENMRKKNPHWKRITRAEKTSKVKGGRGAGFLSKLTQTKDWAKEKAVGAKDYVTDKEYRRKRKIEKKAAKKKFDIEAQRLAEERVGEEETEEAAKKRTDEKPDEGALKHFNIEIKNAILERQRGPRKTIAPSEMDFIDILFHRRLIDAIEDREMLNPREKVDTKYAVAMKKRRAALAEGLRKRTIKPHSISLDELDVIYVTVLGDEKLWSKAAWDPKPTPPDAFFKFLESVALRTQGEKAGEYIGGVFKTLYKMKSAARPDEEMLGELIDPKLVDRYTEERVGRQLRIMMDDFKALVTNLLQSPLEKLHPELKVPGLMIEQVTEEEVNEKEAAVSAALEKLNEKEAQEARIRVEQAKKDEDAKRREYDSVNEKIEKLMQDADAGRKQLSQQQRNKLAGIERMAREALETATAARKNAEKVLNIKTIEKQKLEEEVKKAEESFEVARRAERDVKAEYGMYIIRTKELKKAKRGLSKEKKLEVEEEIQRIEEDKIKAKQKVEDVEKRREQARKALEIAANNLSVTAEFEETIEELMNNVFGSNQVTQEKEEAQIGYREAQREYGRIRREKEGGERACAGLESMFLACISKYKSSGDSLENTTEMLRWEHPSVMKWADKTEELQERKFELSTLENLELKKVKNDIVEIINRREEIGKLMQAAGKDEAFAKQREELAEKIGELKKSIEEKELNADLKIALNKLADDLEKLTTLPSLGVLREVKKREGDEIKLTIVGYPTEDLVTRINNITSTDAKARFNKEMSDFKAELKKATLPDEIKARIEMIVESEMPIDQTAEKVKNEVDEKIRKRYGYPIRKVAEAVIKRFGAERERVGRITNKQALIVRNIWFESDEELEPLALKKEKGTVKRIKRRALWTLSGQCWSEMGEKILDKTAGIRENFSSEKRAENVVGISPKTGEPYRHWLKNWKWGVVKVFVASHVFFLFAGGVRGCLDGDTSPGCWGLKAGCENITARQYPDWEENPPWYLPSWLEPLLNRRGNPFPFGWTLPLRTPYIEQENARRIIHDNYDIPERLSDRGEAYYRKAYGMGRTLAHEVDDDGVDDRLDWLEDNPDVLRFFQERRTMRKVLEWKELYGSVDDVEQEMEPKVCNVPHKPKEKKGKKKKKEAKKEGDKKTEEEPGEEEKVETQRVISKGTLPETCTNLNLTLEDIGNDELAETEEGWEKGVARPWDKSKDEVCCLIEMKVQEIEDGLKLNRYEADRFVALLMAQERGGLTIDDVDRQLAGRTELTMEDIEKLGVHAPDVGLPNINKLLKQRREGSEESREKAVDELEMVLEGLGKTVPGKKIDYEYLTDPNNRARWIEERFLITKDEDKIMGDYGIGEPELVEMVLIHSDVLEDENEPLLKRLMEEGTMKKYLKDKENMGAFLRLLKDNMIEEDEKAAKEAEKEWAGVDPSKEKVSPEVVRLAFDKTVEDAEKEELVEDCTTEFEKRKIVGEIRQLVPQAISKELDDGTVSILQSQDDIRKLVMRFAGIDKRYKLDPYRFDDFVRLVAQHKHRDGEVDDYNPFLSPMGKHASWAVRKGYIISWTQYNTMVQAAKLDKDKETRLDTKAFFENNKDLDVLLTGIIQGSGKRAQNAEESIRVELVNTVMRDEPEYKGKRKRWKGIKVDEKGALKIVDEVAAMEELEALVKDVIRPKRRR